MRPSKSVEEFLERAALIGDTAIHAIQLERERCLKAVEEEPETPYDSSFNMILHAIKSNIRKRIEEGV